MSSPQQGYLWKKPAMNRWLRRFYAYEADKNRLSYWKNKKDYHAGQAAKGFFLDKALLKVEQPDRLKKELFNLRYSDRTLVLKAETANEAQAWVECMQKKITQEGKTTEYVYDEQEMLSWTEKEIVQMMLNGMRMTAYFQNETCKQFKLFCVDNVMYACPVSAGIEKSIIQFPLRRISDIYVGKQTPGFDTDIAFPVPFENCFTIISNQYTLDVDAGSPTKANHWLNGIKYLLTESGKAVIINENEDEDEEYGDEAETDEGAADPAAQNEAEAAAAAEVPEAAEDEPVETPVTYETRLRRTALVIVDMQKDYMTGGPVALPGANEIIPVINGLRKRCTWDLVLLTQNWRPSDHSCFYESNKANPKAKIGQALEVGGRLQIMWPQHCVANTSGAEFPEDLFLEDTDMVIQKATDASADTKSCFRNYDMKKTSLEAVLAQHAIDDVFLVGIGFDTVITDTAMEGQQIHYNVFVVEDACRAFYDRTKQVMTKKLRMGGVPIITTKDIPDDTAMSDELIQAARADMAMDDDADSGDEGDESQALSASVFAAGDGSDAASPPAGSPSPTKKKGAKKGASSKKGSKKGVRIVGGTKKTSSGKTVTVGTKSAVAKQGAKKGAKKPAAKKPASKKPASKKPASKAGSKKPASTPAKKPASKKPASKK